MDIVTYYDTTLIDKYLLDKYYSNKEIFNSKDISNNVDFNSLDTANPDLTIPKNNTYSLFQINNYFNYPPPTDKQLGTTFEFNKKLYKDLIRNDFYIIDGENISKKFMFDRIPEENFINLFS